MPQYLRFLPQQYFDEGDFLLVKLPLRATLILCSAKAAFDLLDKRSNIYSDRPRSVMDEL